VDFFFYWLNFKSGKGASGSHEDDDVAAKFPNELETTAPRPVKPMDGPPKCQKASVTETELVPPI